LAIGDRQSAIIPGLGWNLALPLAGSFRQYCNYITQQLSITRLITFFAGNPAGLAAYAYALQEQLAQKEQLLAEEPRQRQEKEQQLAKA
jgi:hypothetical protein